MPIIILFFYDESHVSELASSTTYKLMRSID